MSNIVIVLKMLWHRRCETPLAVAVFSKTGFNLKIE